MNHTDTVPIEQYFKLKFNHYCLHRRLRHRQRNKQFSKLVRAYQTRVAAELNAVQLAAPSS